jgi:RimJ/RimL family protein N-acetyltransferase
MPPPRLPIRTERLVLRPFEDGDLDALHGMHGRDDVSRYLPPEPLTREQARALLARVMPLRAIDEEPHAVRLAAVLPETGEVIGDFSLWRLSEEHREGEIGFVLHPDHHGRGYAAEAAIELLRLGFEGGLHRIVGRCDARNVGSARLMKRLGMRQEAHLVENEYIKGEWTDELIFAMLESEWAAASG